MNHRVGWLASGSAATILIGIAVLALQPKPAPGLTDSKFDRLNAAMKQGDIITLIGRDPDEQNCHTIAWDEKGRRFVVNFDTDGYAIRFFVTDTGEPPKSEYFDLEKTWIVSVRRWFGRYVKA